MFNKLPESIEYFADRLFNDCRYHIDASKLYSLGWKPKVDFDTGLKKTSEFPWLQTKYNIDCDS